MYKKLKIAIVTSGRFHVCHLARELSALGHEVKFYSLVPPWRTKKFGLPTQCNRWVLPRVFWKAAKVRLSRGKASSEQRVEELILAFDSAVARTLEPCDVLIGMSGMCNSVGIVAKEKYGARVWIERGSRHILSQQKILASIPAANQVSTFSVKRELIDYKQADAISVLAKHCEESFIENGVSPNKLVRNPLGVDLSEFHPSAVPNTEPTIIMAGTWSMQKGCNILIDAWRRLEGVKLIHVGGIADCPLPDDSNFTHYDKVDQNKLVDYYSRAHVFALASHQEGLATVQPQALACGLRLVCTTRTGGEDLIQFVNESDVISVVPPNDVDALATALFNAVEVAKKESGIRNRLRPDGGENLSWKGYGRRYAQNLANRQYWD